MQATLNSFVSRGSAVHDQRGVSHRQRKRLGKYNPFLNTVCRVAALNVGGRMGWRRGAAMTLDWLNADILFLLDTKARASVRADICNVIAETWSDDTASSSMAVIAKDPSRWKVIQMHSGSWGCCIKVTDGFHRACGIYSRPTDKRSPQTDRMLQQVINWLSPAGIIIGDWNARHTDWDKIIEPRGRALKALCSRTGSRVVAPDTPTFVTQKGSSTVDFAVVKGWTATILAQRAPAFMPADHSAVVLTGARSDRRQDKSTTPRFPRKFQMDSGSIQERESSWAAFTRAPHTQPFGTYMAWTTWIRQRWGVERKPFTPGWTVACEKAAEYWKLARAVYLCTRKKDDYDTAAEAARLKRRIIQKERQRVRASSARSLASAGPAHSVRAMARLLAMKEKYVQSVDSAEWLKLLSAKSGDIGQPRTPKEPYAGLVPNDWGALASEALGQLKNNKSPGFDAVPAELLKAAPAVVYEVFRDTVDDIFRCGRLPEAWRRTKLVMVPKKDPRSSNPADFRPVALISHQRKLLERCVANKIYDRMKLHQCQHGFRKGTGTTWPVALLDAQLKASRKYTALSLDIAGAFDCADLAVIRSKILALGLESDVEYLALVFVNESTCMEIDGHHFWTGRGVAQGSVLGPLFWILFVDSLAVELAKVLHKKPLRPFPVLMYADDIIILLDLDDTAETTAVEAVLNSWAKAHNMTWSAPKSYLVLPEGVQLASPIRLHGIQVNQCTSTRYLGFMINSDGLDLQKHVALRIEKAQSRAAFMQLRGLTLPHVSVAAIATAYKAFVRPILEYGIGIFDRTCVSSQTFQLLEAAQSDCLAKLTTIDASKSKSLCILLRLGTMRDRHEERLWRLQHALRRPEAEVMVPVHAALTELRHHLADPIPPGALSLLESKANLIRYRMRRWKAQTASWKSKPPQCHAMPPMLHGPDGVSTRWVLKWYLGLGLYGPARGIVDAKLPGGIAQLRKDLSKDTLTTAEVHCVRSKVLLVRNVFKSIATQQQRVRRTSRQA